MIEISRVNLDKMFTDLWKALGENKAAEQHKMLDLLDDGIELFEFASYFAEQMPETGFSGDELEIFRKGNTEPAGHIAKDEKGEEKFIANPVYTRRVYAHTFAIITAISACQERIARALKVWYGCDEEMRTEEAVKHMARELQDVLSRYWRGYGQRADDYRNTAAHWKLWGKYLYIEGTNDQLNEVSFALPKDPKEDPKNILHVHQLLPVHGVLNAFLKAFQSLLAYTLQLLKKEATP